MATGISTTILRYQYDDASGKRTVQGVESIGKATDSVTARINRLRIEASHTAKELADIDIKLRSGNLSGKQLEDAVLRASRLEEQLHSINEELDRAGDSRGGTGIGGNTLTELGTQLRNLPALQLPGVGFSTETIANITRSLGRLSQEGGGLPSFGQALGLIRQKVPEVVNAIGAGPLGMIGALGALTLAVKLLERQATQGSEQITEQINAAQDVNRRRRLGTTEGLTAQLEDDQRNLDEAAADLETSRHALALTYLEYLKNDPVRLSVGSIVSGLGFDTPLNRARQAVDDAQKAFDEANNSINITKGLLDDETVKRNDLAALQEDYNDQLEKTGPALEQLNRQQVELNAAFDEQVRRREEDQRLQARFQTEDRTLEDEQRASRHQANLADIEETGNQRVEDIRSKSIKRLGELESSLNDNLATIGNNLNKQIGKVNEDFREDELNRARRFRDTENKIAEDYQKERRRRLEDDAQELLSAEIANDTAAFIQAKQRQRVDGKREQEDFEDGQRQRRAAFDEERRERQQEKEARLDDLRTEARERTLTAIEEFGKQKAALEQNTLESIAIEKAAIQERTNEVIAAYDAESDALIKSRERADERQRTLEGIQEQRRQDAHRQALADIDEKRQAEESALTSILNRINALNVQLRNSFTPQQQSTASLTGANNLRAFARGTLGVDRPTNALVGDVRPGFAEAIIPYNKSAGLAAELQRLGITGGAPSVDLRGAVFGGEITAADLEAFGVKIVNGIAQGVSALRSGALPND